MVQLTCFLCKSGYLRIASKAVNSKFCSKKCLLDSLHIRAKTKEYREKISKKMKELKLRPANYKETATYDRVHGWLRYNYGPANKCEWPTCDGKSKFFDWAKIKDKEYTRERSNFMMLCRGCHLRYDMTEKRRNQVIKNLKYCSHLVK